MGIRKLAIALSFKGKIINKIENSWKILLKEFNIKYISDHNCKPHITLFAGNIKKKDITKVYISLKKLKLKTFKITSPGIGIFANKYPNLFIRWKKNLNIILLRNLIIKDTLKFFITQNPYTKDNLWEPRSTIAYKDLNYYHIENLFNKLNFMFRKHSAQIDYVLLIDYTIKEKIIYKIKFNKL